MWRLYKFNPLFETNVEGDSGDSEEAQPDCPLEPPNSNPEGSTPIDRSSRDCEVERVVDKRG